MLRRVDEDLEIEQILVQAFANTRKQNVVIRLRKGGPIGLRDSTSKSDTQRTLRTPTQNF